MSQTPGEDPALTSGKRDPVSSGGGANQRPSYFPAVIVGLALLSCVVGLKISISTLRAGNVNVYLPTSFEDIKSLDATVAILINEYFWTTSLLFCSLYILKQTFAIPGSLVLNVTAGRIFGLYVGFSYITIVRPTDPCKRGRRPLSPWEILSGRRDTFGKRLVSAWFPTRLAQLQSLVNRHRSNLLYYLIFMRAVSFVPNWFVNLASPVLGIPLSLGAVAVFIGMSPYHYICTQAGAVLSTIESASDIFDGPTILKMVAMASLATLPVILQRVLGGKGQQEQEAAAAASSQDAKKS